MEGASHPDPTTLRRIRSLSQFDDNQLAELATRLSLYDAQPGECLIDLGSCENFSLYLVAGSVAATSHDGNETNFDAGGDDELYPIAQIRPSLYRVVAREPVRFFRLHADQLTEFAQHQAGEPGDDGIDVVEFEQTVAQSSFTIQLFQDLMAGDLNLPSLPIVAQRIQEAFASDAVNAAVIGAIIQADPAITAKLIKTANSALYRGQAPIESLQQAVVRLGLETTRKQVMTYAVSELFEGRTPALKQHMRGLRKHSQQVASLSRLLARNLSGFDLEQAQLAGLVHDLGEVAILQYAQQSDELCRDTDMLFEAVRSLRPQVTGMLLGQWHFGDDFVTVGEQSEDWFRNPGDQPDLCDLVLIAQYHAMIDCEQAQRLPPVSTLPAFAKLGMSDLSRQQITQFMAQSRAEIEAIEAHLNAA